MLFKPLEESLVELERCARSGKKELFDEETKIFYKRIGVLEKYCTLRIEDTSALVKHYQQRYDQLKLIIQK